MTTYQTLTINVIKSIINIFETGAILGKYDSLTILDDNAGITYGAAQTTENGGGLYQLLNIYLNLPNIKYPQLQEYLDYLYDGQDSSKKYNLTSNKHFKQLLIHSGRNDSQMKHAQDAHFDKNYFQPALTLADDFCVLFPLSIAVIYDSCIHSGPIGAKKRLSKWDNQSEHDTEEGWIQGYVDFRKKWLQNYPNPVVRKTTYRMKAFENIIQTDNWLLDLPLNIYLPHKKVRITNRFFR